MNKHLLFLIVGFIIILSCKKDNGSTNDPSAGGDLDKDWTISTSSTFHLKDVLDVVYVQDNKDDERLEAIVTLSLLPNKNNPSLKGEFQFVIDYDGKSNLNISPPIAFSNADFVSKEFVQKDVSIVLPGNISKIGTIKMKMREKLNDKWTEYKYADKVYKTTYAKAETPTIEGPEQVDKEAIYTIINAAEVVLENANEIATLTKVSETTWKLTKIGTAYGTVTIKATNKDKVSVVKEVLIGTPLPEIDGPVSIENEATYIISNAEHVMLENADKIATLTKVNETTYKVTKVGTAYGKVTIKATNKAGAAVTKEVTVGIALPTIVGVDVVETEATYTINNASEVVLENNNNIATLTKVTETSWKITKVGTAYGKVTIKATNKAGAVVKKEVTVGEPLPTISGLASFENESTYTITNATTVVLENNNNIATLTKVTETSWKITKVGTAYGTVTIKATNKAGAVAKKEVTVGVPLPVISGLASFETESTYTITNATTVVLENNNNIATLTKVTETSWKITKVGTAYGTVTIKATNKAGAVVKKEVTVGVPLPTISGLASFETESTYTITNATTVVLENNNNIATLTKVTETSWKITKVGTAYGTVTIKATNKAGAVMKKEVTVGVPLPTISGLASFENESTYTITNATTVVLENNNNIATLTKVTETSWKITKVGTAYGTVTIKATNKAGAVVKKEVTVGVPLPTISGLASFENESTYTITNATMVVLENNNNIATLTKVTETSWKITKVGTAYGTVTIKATNKAGAVVKKEVTVGVPLPTISGLASFEIEATYTIMNATTVVLENNNNIATLTKVTETSWKVTKVGTAYGKVTIKATNKAGASVSKNITVGTQPALAPSIEGSATVCKEEIYTIKNATSVTLENAEGIATLASLGNDQYKIVKVGNGLITLNASHNNGSKSLQQVVVGTPAPILNGSLTLMGGEMGVYSVSSIDPNSKLTYSISDGANLYVVEYDSEFEFRIFMSERFLGKIPVEIKSTNKCGTSSITIYISRY